MRLGLLRGSLLTSDTRNALGNALGNAPCNAVPARYNPAPRRDAAKARLRRWKRHRARWITQPTFDGDLFAERLACGRARPFELGAVYFALREVLSARALAFWAVVVACERGFGGHSGGVRISHRTTARILRCSERAAGDAVRELVALGLVEQRPWFRLRAAEERTAAAMQKHNEVRARYVTTARGTQVLAMARGNLVGKNRQPGRIQRSLREHSKGVRGRGRPEQRFVSEVLAAARLRPTSSTEVATVIERRPDGSVALGSPLTADAVEQRQQQRLRTEGGGAKQRDDFDDVLARAWRAFEATHASQSEGSAS